MSLQDQGRERTVLLIVILAISMLLVAMCSEHAKSSSRTVKVTASAYNTLPGQTDATPNVGACGRIKPGSKIIAVSNDLYKKGLKCGTKVTIKGKTYTVWDRMHKRWNNKIDICFHKNLHAARNFGVQKVKLKY
jgi:3D (Asp-Asp-Asp) domain-containing protein